MMYVYATLISVVETFVVCAHCAIVAQYLCVELISLIQL